MTVSSSQPLTLGSASDRGNLLSVLKLDTAQITFAAGTYTATSTAKIGGINVGATMNTSNNAGFATAVTAGAFSINGVRFNVDPAANNLNDVLKQINASSAGVVASYDAGNDRIMLTAKASGPQGITLGSSGDTSNFLQSAGFLATTRTERAQRRRDGRRRQVGARPVRRHRGHDPRRLQQLQRRHQWFRIISRLRAKSEIDETPDEQGTRWADAASALYCRDVIRAAVIQRLVEQRLALANASSNASSSPVAESSQVVPQDDTRTARDSRTRVLLRQDVPAHFGSDILGSMRTPSAVSTETPPPETSSRWPITTAG